MDANISSTKAAAKAPAKASATMEQHAAVKNGVVRLVFAGLAILVEVVFILLLNLRFAEQAEWFAIGTRVLAAALVLFIYNTSSTSSAMKMPWIILIMALPLFGVMLYLLIGLNGSTRRMRQQYEQVDKRLLPLLPDGTSALARLDAKDRRAANIARYVQNTASYPLYDDTTVTYYPDAAAGLEAQKRELAAAQDFIFMEYHAIEDAESWHGIQEILEERVRAGVEVRVFYDDMGSIGFINTDFVGRLEAVDIRCKVFNALAPGLNLFLNNRDHRKITVVDGRVGFTGGYNLANEYFNLTHPFGHWKDTGVRLEGGAVQSLTAAFLEMWNAVSDVDGKGRPVREGTPRGALPRGADKDLARYLAGAPALKAAGASAGAANPAGAIDQTDAGAANESGTNANAGAANAPTTAAAPTGFVLPYADSPMDDAHVGEDVYISMAEYAQNYVWFVSPYLVITDEMTHALGLAAQRGVDVRVVTPGIPDKKLVYALTRSYYHALVRNGVRIFEYTPGFCHCKMSVADDRIATCGTINLDFRSLYHHFENGCLYYGCDAVADTRADFESMFAESREVTDAYKNPGAGFRIMMLFMRLVAPLM